MSIRIPEVPELTYVTTWVILLDALSLLPL